LRVCLARDDEWAFRIPFAIQWVWPAFLIPLLSFAPESPWHLVRQHRLEEAEKSLRRLQRASASIDVKETLASIVYTNNLEEELSVGTSYFDCFSGFERRRTEIACICFAGQVLSGSSFAYNASYFFEQVGLATETTYSLNLGGTGLALFGTLVNWFCLMPYFGRRTIYVVGMFAMAMTLYLIGVLNVWTGQQPVAMTQAVLTLVCESPTITLSYQYANCHTQGPSCSNSVPGSSGGLSQQKSAQRASDKRPSVSLATPTTS
jgi:SP family general alpha glucoside:H+ symporter-like MFS transporter